MVPSAHCRQLAARMQMATHPSPTKSTSTSGRWNVTPNVKASSTTFLSFQSYAFLNSCNYKMRHVYQYSLTGRTRNRIVTVV